MVRSELWMCVVTFVIHTIYGKYHETSKPGREHIEEIMFADDLVLTAEGQIRLQEMVSSLDQQCKNYGMRISRHKTEVTVTSREPIQCDILGPILFLVYINDLEEGVTGSILKFADDTKLFRKTKDIEDKHILQDDIDKLVKWSEKWQMLFNFGKCKCLHTGPGNPGMNYEMGGTILSKILKEKDLGVTMNANMNVSEQCRIAASKGNQVLGMIRRNITYKENSLILPLYKAIVRPHLE